jgi:ubiquinol-cytochrome c reductase iron-sulfur subunit
VRRERRVSLAGAAERADDEARERRKFLWRAVAAVGALGSALSAWPFIASLSPSARARALGGPVALDLSGLEVGQMSTFVWRSKPIFVLRRTPAMLSLLGEHDAQLKDPHSLDSEQPAYARNDWRSREADLFVTVGICTHLGCLPKARLQAGEPPLGPTWPGGFFCPCHGSRFDLAGRVFDGSPAPVNLVIPPYAFSSRNTLVVGVDSVKK